MIDLSDVVLDTYDLEPLPASVIKLLNLLSTDDWSLDSVVSTASLDAALTARIMRVANSAASSAATPVNTLHESTMRLGATTVVKLAIAFAVRRHMTAGDEVSSTADSEQSLWRLSVATALAADLIKERTSVPISQEAFTVALLSDIGRIILAQHLDVRINEFVSRAVVEGRQSPLEAEREILGVDHAELGALIAEHWQLPAQISESIRFHHTPSNAMDEEVETLCDAVTVADAVARRICHDEAVTRVFDCSESCARPGLEEDDFEALCEQAAERLEAALASYE